MMRYEYRHLQAWSMTHYGAITEADLNALGTQGFELKGVQFSPDGMIAGALLCHAVPDATSDTPAAKAVLPVVETRYASYRSEDGEYWCTPCSDGTGVYLNIRNTHGQYDRPSCVPADVRRKCRLPAGTIIYVWSESYKEWVKGVE